MHALLVVSGACGAGPHGTFCHVRARTEAGSPLPATTQRRQRAVFCNALQYRVDLRLLPSDVVGRTPVERPGCRQRRSISLLWPARG